MPERISSKERRGAFFFILKFGLKGTPLTTNRSPCDHNNGGYMDRPNLSEKDVKRVWVEDDAICVELKDGRIGRELIRDYEPLRKATRKQLENCRVDCNGVWFDDLDEGLELSGFFSPEKLDN